MSGNIQVRFFASLREQVGKAEMQLDAGSVTDVNTVWQQATGNQPMPDNTLMAVNMDYVSADTPVQAGDEVAFFPPVTGG